MSTAITHDWSWRSMATAVRGDLDDILYEQEHQDDIFYKVYDFEMEENEVTKDFQVWPKAVIFGFGELEERERWIGTTRTFDSSRTTWARRCSCATASA